MGTDIDDNCVLIILILKNLIGEVSILPFLFYKVPIILGIIIL